MNNENLQKLLKKNVKEVFGDDFLAFAYDEMYKTSGGKIEVYSLDELQGLNYKSKKHIAEIYNFPYGNLFYSFGEYNKENILSKLIAEMLCHYFNLEIDKIEYKGIMDAHFNYIIKANNKTLFVSVARKYDREKSIIEIFGKRIIVPSLITYNQLKNTIYYFKISQEDDLKLLNYIKILIKMLTLKFLNQEKLIEYKRILTTLIYKIKNKFYNNPVTKFCKKFCMLFIELSADDIRYFMNDTCTITKWAEVIEDDFDDFISENNLYDIDTTSYPIILNDHHIKPLNKKQLKCLAELISKELVDKLLKSKIDAVLIEYI